MPSTPRPPIPNKGIFKRLKPLLEWLCARAYEPGDASIAVTQDENGGLIFATGIAGDDPFRVRVYKEGSQWKAALSAGTIFNLQASGLSVDVAAAVINVTPGATKNYFYLACTVNDFSATEGNVTAAVFTHDGTTAPVTGDAATTTKLTLATCQTIDGALRNVTQFVRHHQSYQRARNWFETPAKYQHIFGPY